VRNLPRGQGVAARRQSPDLAEAGAEGEVWGEASLGGGMGRANRQCGARGDGGDGEGSRELGA
jgi:hypothetical protein